MKVFKGTIERERVLLSPDEKVRWADGTEVGGICPVKRARSGNVLNKAGRIVLKGKIGKHDVKVFEAASVQHARFIQHVSAHAPISKVFPSILGISGRFLAARWIEGDRFSDLLVNSQYVEKLLQKIASVQAELHNVTIQALPAPGFDYWTCFIKPRFFRACELLDLAKTAVHACSEVEEMWCSSPQILLHPDLTPDNIIVEADGRLRLVDNELVCAGGIALMDLCNTLHSLDQRHRCSYLEYYRELVDDTVFSQKNQVAVKLLWLARVVGSLFVGGHIHEACHLISAFDKGENILPITAW